MIFPSGSMTTPCAVQSHDQGPAREGPSGGVTTAVFAAARRRAGLGRVYAHQMRHRAVTSMLADGGSLAAPLRGTRPVSAAAIRQYRHQDGLAAS